MEDGGRLPVDRQEHVAVELVLAEARGHDGERLAGHEEPLEQEPLRLGVLAVVGADGPGRTLVLERELGHAVGLVLGAVDAAADAVGAAGRGRGRVGVAQLAAVAVEAAHDRDVDLAVGVLALVLRLLVDPRTEGRRAGCVELGHLLAVDEEPDLVVEVVLTNGRSVDRELVARVEEALEEELIVLRVAVVVDADGPGRAGVFEGELGDLVGLVARALDAAADAVGATWRVRRRVDHAELAPVAVEPAQDGDVDLAVGVLALVLVLLVGARPERAGARGVELGHLLAVDEEPDLVVEVVLAQRRGVDRELVARVQVA